MSVACLAKQRIRVGINGRRVLEHPDIFYLVTISSVYLYISLFDYLFSDTEG